MKVMDVAMDTEDSDVPMSIPKQKKLKQGKFLLIFI